MPKQPAPAPTETVEQPSEPKKAADLTVNKVIAGAGAAATSAVLGSYFGATGTVAGAALGSVALTVSTTLYQRSLDRTRDVLVARVRIAPGRRVDLADAPTVRLAVPQPRVSPEDATTRLRVAPALRRPRKVWVWAGVTVLAFVLGLLAVTGIEWAKGSTLSTGQPGTSVGRVLAPGPATDDGPATSEDGEAGTDGAGTDVPDGAVGENPDGDGQERGAGTEPDRDQHRDAGADPGGDSARDRPGDSGAGEPDDEPRAGSGADPSTPNPEPTERPTPTPEPDLDAGSGGDASGSEGAGTSNG